MAPLKARLEFLGLSEGWVLVVKALSVLDKSCFAAPVLTFTRYPLGVHCAKFLKGPCRKSVVSCLPLFFQSDADDPHPQLWSNAFERIATLKPST